MMLVGEGDKTSWVWKTKEDGMLSTIASLGCYCVWDVENGLDKIDKYTYADEDQIKAGALLAIGIHEFWCTNGLRAGYGFAQH